MERVKEGEDYWYIEFPTMIVECCGDWRYCGHNEDYENNNYFHTPAEAEAMARKLRAVLKGAEVIKMPSEEELENEATKIALTLTGGPMKGVFKIACKYMANWLESKIVK